MNLIINKEKLKRRFSRNAKQYDKYANIQKKMGKRLIDLPNIEKKNIKVLEVGCGTGYVTRLLLEKYENISITALDIASGMIDVSKNLLDKSKDRVRFIVGDIEDIILEEKFDLIISNATFQWFNDFEKTLKKLTSMLSDEGQLCFSTFGEETFNELHTSFNYARKELNLEESKTKNHQFYALEDLKIVLNDNLDLKELESFEEVEKEYFKDCLEFMYSVKKIGANNSQADRIVHPELINYVMKDYDNRHIEDDKVFASYHLLFFKLTV